MRLRSILACFALLCASCVTAPTSRELRVDRSGRAERQSRVHPRGMVMFRGGSGDGEVDETGMGPIEPDADFGGFQFEMTPRSLGGGLQVDFFENDDVGGAESSGFEIFPHFTSRPAGGDFFRIPIRIGPMIQVHSFDLPGADRTFVNLGAMVELEPEIDLVRKRPFALSLYGRVRGGVGSAIIDDDFTDETYLSNAVTYGAEGGVRFQAGGFLFTAGYVGLRRTDYEESDPENAVVIPETAFDYDGIFFSFGGRW